MKFRQGALAAGLAATAVAANATPTAEFYGLIDMYLNYMHSSSGARVESIEDGSFYSSRVGVRGSEDLGDGYSAKVQLETGFSGQNGAQSDTSRLFNRQAWVGVGTPYGDVRLGRQISPIYARGCNIDYGCRSTGSLVNDFGLPVRFDNEVGFKSNRMYGVQADLQVSLPESPVGNSPYIVLAGADWTNDVFTVGYAGARERAPTHAVIDKPVVYDNYFVNWNYGKGTVYLVYVRSNNSTASGGINNGGTIVGNSGGYNAGTNPDLNHFYGIYQLSADYRVYDRLRIGGLWGKIDDQSGRQRGATGGSIGAFYDWSKSTTLTAWVDTLHNQANGGWRPAAAGAVKDQFTTATDVNGRTISGVQLGITHRF